MYKIDKYWIGVVIGLILPALFIYVYIDHFNLWATMRMFGSELRETWCKLLLLSVFPNFALLFIFYAAEAWKLSKGLLYAAFPYLLASIAVIL